MVGGDDPFYRLYLKFWAKLTQPPSKTLTSSRYSLLVQLSLIESPLLAFQWA